MFDYQFPLHEKIISAKRMMKEYEPPEGYILAFSGGKDSVVLLDLAKRAQIKFQAQDLITTIEHPETVEFVSQFPEVEMIPPRNSIFELIEKKGFPPLRKYRYCTSEVKARNERGRFKLIGIRAGESKKRAKYPQVVDEGKDRHLYPIFDWSEADIWQYIGRYRLKYHPLYNCGYKRVGCVLCPYAQKHIIEYELKRYPEIVEKYRQACIRAYEKRIADGKTYRDIHNGDELFQWWLRCLLNK